MSRSIEAKVLPACRELGIGVTAYGVHSRGLLSGRVGAEGYAGKRDFRAHAPRFVGDNLAANRRLVERLAQVAAARGATTTWCRWSARAGASSCGKRSVRSSLR
jgi:aryl-alcohol dehydrogenase-like predicted oxidoreductase